MSIKKGFFRDWEEGIVSAAKMIARKVFNDFSLVYFRMRIENGFCEEADNFNYTREFCVPWGKY